MKRLFFVLALYISSVFCEEINTTIYAESSFLEYIYFSSNKTLTSTKGSWITLPYSLLINGDLIANGLNIIFNTPEGFFIVSDYKAEDLPSYQLNLIKNSFLDTLFYQVLLQSGLIKVIDYYWPTYHEESNANTYIIITISIFSSLKPSRVFYIIQRPYVLIYYYASAAALAEIYSKYGFISVFSNRLIVNLLVCNLSYFLQHLTLRPTGS